MTAIGHSLTNDDTHDFGFDELFVTQMEKSMSEISQVPDRATVARFYEAALAAGGTDNGGPGERSYRPGYYAAFVLDPDGNNIEAVFHGPAEIGRVRCDQSYLN